MFHSTISYHALVSRLGAHLNINGDVSRDFSFPRLVLPFTDWMFVVRHVFLSFVVTFLEARVGFA